MLEYFLHQGKKATHFLCVLIIRFRQFGAEKNLQNVHKFFFNADPKHCFEPDFVLERVVDLLHSEDLVPLLCPRFLQQYININS